MQGIIWLDLLLVINMAVAGWGTFLHMRIYFRQRRSAYRWIRLLNGMACFLAFLTYAYALINSGTPDTPVLRPIATFILATLVAGGMVNTGEENATKHN